MSFLTKLFGAKPGLADTAFLKEERTGGNIYKVYRSTSRETALAFLRQTPVEQERVYLVCETPEGNFGKDMIMIYDESTQKRIEFGQRAPVAVAGKSMERCARCGYPVLPAGAFTADLTIVAVEEMKEKGVGCVCRPCRTLWCPFCLDTLRPGQCPICRSTLEIFHE